MTLAERLQRAWYGPRRWLWCLYPLHLLMLSLVSLRRYLFSLGILRSTRLTVPVIVVGNITVGGSGKTPLTTHVVQRLQQWGYRPGIVSRGYGAHPPQLPLVVEPDSLTAHCGDEPLLLKRRCQVPVIVDPDRVRGAQALQKLGCNIIVCDDGLQHYRLQRDIEIHVVDAVRQLGNGWLLPAGHLREPPSRLQQCALRVGNGAAIAVIGEHAMQLQMTEAHALQGMQRKPLIEFAGQPVHAVAGIGYPERFFRQLQAKGMVVQGHAFPDHHAFRPGDFPWQDRALLMTEKDAVKCAELAISNAWYVPVVAQLDLAFDTALQQAVLQLLQKNS